MILFKRIFFSILAIMGLVLTIISFDHLTTEANQIMHLTAAALLAIGVAQVYFTFDKKKK
ncbi:hypothetical protein [Kurthia senegalensis]|uniref:hypothetical protein n=1 Tax=Kurthia senegalensis TaxID=1033740 RepID=UPI00031FA682|nr:hypothetical protein [Kurthia senegalensis]